MTHTLVSDSGLAPSRVSRGMDMDTRLRRFEQQLSAFEKLHAGELKDLQEKLAALVRLQADEIKLLREELAELKRALQPTPSSTLAGPQGETEPAASGPSEEGQR